MKKRGGKEMRGKVFVSLIAVFSMALGSVVAKAADYPVNMLLSENTAVFNSEEIEIITDESFSDENEDYSITNDFDGNKISN